MGQMVIKASGFAEKTLEPDRLIHGEAFDL